MTALFIGAAATAQVTVTFQVDVTNYVAGLAATGGSLDPTGIRVGGNFSTNGGTANGGPMADWSPTTPTSAMTDLGNGIWEIAVDFPTANVGSLVLYKFINGNWGMNEGTDPANTIVAGGCGVDDGSGNINRTLEIPNANTTLTYCWDMCTASCSGSGANVVEGAISNLVVSPNPANDVATFNFTSNAANADIVLFDLSGKVVASKSVATGAVNNVEVSTSALSAGSYIYQVTSAGSVVTGKLMKK